MTVSGYAFTLMGSRAVGEFAIMKTKVKKMAKGLSSTLGVASAAEVTCFCKFSE